jgi:hypothetical protein
MAEMDWTRPLPAAPPRELPAWLRGFAARFLDWEDWLTLALMAGAILSVSVTLETGGWSRNMPAITLVALLGAVTALVLTRLRMPALLAWPATIAIGGGVVFWQTLLMVGPGSLEQRLDAVYYRFDAWLNAAFNDLVNNDPLPLHVLTLGVTWLGVTFFSWGVFRWHNAWLGLIPGGLALFVDLAYVGDDLSGAFLLFSFFGFLLVMRTNLTAKMASWKAEGTTYPPLISFTFLNFATWVLLSLIAVAWVAPTGPFSTPGPVLTLAERFNELGVNFVRLAGPLHVKKVVPIHNYSGVLPFQGSVKLGDREVLEVKVNNPDVQGPFVLRGNVYGKYGSGGWEAGEQDTAKLSPYRKADVETALESGELDGVVIPLQVEVLAKSVVGNVLFTVGQPLNSTPAVAVKIPAGSLRETHPVLPDGGRGLTDQAILRDHVSGRYIGVSVARDSTGAVEAVNVFDTRQQAVMDTLALSPGGRIQKGQTYRVTSFVQTFTADELRDADGTYPGWVTAQYLQLPPETLSPRISRLAAETGYRDAETTYDIIKNIEGYLRGFPLDYDVPDTPPAHDTVNYFLFDLKRGYFDYHASAMVVMLRILGIPARLGVGFVVDERDYQPDEEAYVVRDRNTYAWAEVYFPGQGWVTFNPSPDYPSDLSPRVRQDLPEIEGLDPSIFDNLPVGADPIFDIGAEAGGGAGDPAATDPGRGYDPWFAAGLTAFLALLAGAAGLGWQRSVAGLPYAQQHWEKLVRMSSWAGYPPQQGQTPVEYARGLQRQFRGLRGVSVLATAYCRSRFAQRDATSEERERIRELWPHLRGALIAGIFGRFLRRR